MKNVRIRKEDNVLVLTGKDKGKIAKVKKVIKKHNLVLVENVNMVKRHVKPNPYRREPGGIVSKEMPLDISNVQIVCNTCTKASRVGYRYDDGKKNRFCKKCNATL